MLKSMTFSRKGKKIGRYDDRLMIRSVIFLAALVGVAVALVFLLTEKGDVLLRASFLIGLVVLAAGGVVLYMQTGHRVDIRNRQAMARMLLENRWFETEPLQRHRQGGRMERITYFPALYYRRKGRYIYVTVKISMGKYQEALLHLEEKLETGLSCELIEKDVRDIWVRYTFLNDVEKNRLSIDDVTAQDGRMKLMRHIVWEYDSMPHMLVAGGTGGGKTYFLMTLIEKLAGIGARLFVIDPKRSALSCLNRVLPEVWSEKDDILDCTVRFYEAMEARYTAMQEHPGYRPGMNYAKLGFEPCFLIFDEYVAFMTMLSKKENETVTGYIQAIILKGREAGFFLILACQRPDAKFLGEGVRDQFGFRATLGKMSSSGYTMMFGSVDKIFMPKTVKGRGYVNTGDDVVTEFYSPLVEDGHDFFSEIGRAYEQAHRGMEQAAENRSTQRDAPETESVVM